MYKFKKVFFTLLFASVVLGALGAISSFASADLGGRALDHGYFYNNDVSATCSGSYCTYGQVIVGGFPDPASFDTSTNGDTGKTNFINFISGELSGGGRNGIGAAFIINTMLGLNGPGGGSTAASLSQTNPATGNTYLQDWENAINQKAVTISYTSYAYSVNSGYQKGYNDDAFFSEGGPHMAVVFNYNGTPVYALKDNCANPVGSLPGVPIPSDPAPQGNVDDYCTSATIRGWAFDESVPTQAIYVDIYVNGAPWKRITANGSRPDVGAAYPGVGNNHGFSIGWDTSKYPLTGTYSVKVYAIGIDKNGNLNNDNPQIGTTGTVGPSCTSGGGGTPLACPGQPSADMTHVKVTFGQGNDGETTYSPSGGDKHNPPSPLQAGDKKDVRTAVGYEAVSATDANTGKSLPVNSDKTTIDFTTSVKDYPYDSNKANVTYTDTYTTTEYTWTVDASGNGSWGSGTLLPGTQVSGQFSDGTAQLGECYYRNFNVLPPSSTDVEGVTLSYSGRPNDENPNQAVVSAQVDVRFTLTPVSGAQKQLRAPMSVAGLNYSASYQIRRPVPGTNSYQTISLGSASQTVPQISCPSTSTDCTVPYAFVPTAITVSVGSGSSQLRPGDMVCAQFAISPAIGTSPNNGGADEGGNIQSGSSGSVDSTRIPGGSTCSSPLVNEPYFKVFGGDISVGNPFALSGTCSLGGASAGVYGWNTEDGSNGYPSHPYAGAGAQYAVTALADDSKDAASNQFNPNASYPTPGNSKGIELSFANTGTSPGSGKFVSNFGAAQSCIPDYFAGAASASGGAPSSNVSSLASNSYYANSNITLSGGNIATGKHITIYAVGNVYITGPIKFANGSYTSIDSIPSFVVVAKGNIYISSSVKELTGVYIAEPLNTTSSDGVISDCATAGGSLPNDQLYTKCNTPLTVNGSFIARDINLLRTTTGDPGPYNENASIRGARADESNSLATTVTETVTETATCTSGVPDSNDICGDAQYHPGSPGSPGYYGSPWTLGGSYNLQPGDDCYNANCSGCTISGSLKSCISGNTETYYWGTYYAGSSGSPPYYTCPGSETVVGSKCKAVVAYAYPPGCTPVPGDPSKCTMNVTPTHASEVFNYNPAFWMNVALPTPGSQGSSYDAITSLPPVL